MPDFDIMSSFDVTIERELNLDLIFAGLTHWPSIHRQKPANPFQLARPGRRRAVILPCIPLRGMPLARVIRFLHPCFIFCAAFSFAAGRAAANQETTSTWTLSRIF